MTVTQIAKIVAVTVSADIVGWPSKQLSGLCAVDLWECLRYDDDDDVDDYSACECIRTNVWRQNGVTVIRRECVRS